MNTTRPTGYYVPSVKELLKMLTGRHRHIHRADLHSGLLKAAMDAGCKLHLDSRVLQIDAWKSSVVTKNGGSYQADLIVASDGECLLRL